MYEVFKLTITKPLGAAQDGVFVCVGVYVGVCDGVLVLVGVCVGDSDGDVGV